MSNIAKIERPVDQSPASAMMELISRAASDDKFSPEKLKELLAVKKEWEADEARKEFVRAMTRFKSDPPRLAKTKHVKFATSKGVTEYDHAELDVISDVIGKALAKEGISHRWTLKDEANRIHVGCVITHVDGHSETTWKSAEADNSGGKNPIQAGGSTITYLQRYTLLSAVGLAVSGQDDDGAGAGNAYIDDGQLADLIGLMDELGDKVDRTKFRSWLESEGVKDGDLKYIPPRLYKQVCGLLEGKRRT